jgi:hypothetical protein
MQGNGQPSYYYLYPYTPVSPIINSTGYGCWLYRRRKVLACASFRNEHFYRT